MKLIQNWNNNETTFKVSEVKVYLWEEYIPTIISSLIPSGEFVISVYVCDPFLCPNYILQQGQGKMDSDSGLVKLFV